MRAYELRGAGLEMLVCVERTAPMPGPGEVRVGVRAAGLNHRDVAIAQGTYPPGRELPLILGSDLAGVVEACGPGSVRFRRGDRVVASYPVDWVSGPPDASRMVRRLGGPLDGALAEVALVPEHALVPIPETVSFSDAATLPVAGVTAWRALFELGRLRPGCSVLLFGTGGVSIFALQLARVAGARAIVVGRSAAKLERARALGATVTIDAGAAWQERVLEATGGAGADVALDVLGGDVTGSIASVVRVGGVLVLVGFMESPRIALDVRNLIRRSLRIEAISAGSRQDLEALVEAVGSGAFRPEIDRVFPFRDAPAAMEHLLRGAHVGKVVVEIEPR